MRSTRIPVLPITKSFPTHGSTEQGVSGQLTGKLKEVMGQYCPVYFGLKYIRESYKRAFPAYYYSGTATYAPPTSGTIWWWAATSKIRNRESVAT